MQKSAPSKNLDEPWYWSLHEMANKVYWLMCDEKLDLSRVWAWRRTIQTKIDLQDAGFRVPRNFAQRKRETPKELQKEFEALDRDSIQRAIQELTVFIDKESKKRERIGAK
jgi:hypothetical protein